MKQHQALTEIPILETKNYLLRGVALDDASRLFAFMQDKITMQFITPHPVQTEEEMEAAIKQYLAKFQEQKEIPWVIIHKEDGALIGQFRLHKLHMWHRKAEMGAVIQQDYQKTGVMTEVLGVILPYVFETLNLNRLVGDIFSGNEGSRRLLEKFGFKKEGVLRHTDFDGQAFHDTVVYSMLKHEYEA
ncbi:GNAT family N-acetyltransferase [Ornithinibacillus xuwenensis]|uniref:GNAT family N-acetyltransferase n=1 Tax=Ornithinibacillus xuwenensis TaxID=3144668 RepID=A0ABU9XH64_9BACI